MMLEIGPSIDEDEFDIFNSLELLAKLTGAPDGSRIVVSRGSGGQDTFNLKVENALFKYPRNTSSSTRARAWVFNSRLIRFMCVKNFRIKGSVSGR